MCRAVLGQIGLEERVAADARVDFEVGVEQVRPDPFLPFPTDRYPPL